MDMYEDFLAALDKAIAQAGNAHRLSILSGVPNNSITRWRARQRVPSLDAVCPLLPFLDWPSTGKPKDGDGKELSACLRERDDLRLKIEQLEKQIVTLEGEKKALRELLDRFLPPANQSSLSAEDKKNSGMAG